MSDDEDLPMKPPSRSLRTNNVTALLDFKTIVLQHSKNSTKPRNIPLVNKTKKNLFVDPDKELKKAKKEQEEAVRRAEKALKDETEMKMTEQRRKMEEKAKLYERLKGGETLVYEDGTKPDFLVDFDRGRSRSRSRSRSPLPPKGSNVQYNYDEEDDYSGPGPSIPRQMEVYYNPLEEKDRIFGASHIPLPLETEERQKKINELLDASLRTAEARVKFKKQQKEKAKEERAKINFIRELNGESPLPSEESSDEEEHPGKGLNPSDIPLPEDPEEIIRREEERKKKFEREWDKGKMREMLWLKERRDEREDEFKPPEFYYKK